MSRTETWPAPWSGPAIGVRLFPLDGEGVLFDERNQRIFHLNSLAALIWNDVAQGRTAPEIARRIVGDGLADDQQAMGWVEGILGQWLGLDLLGLDLLAAGGIVQRADANGRRETAVDASPRLRGQHWDAWPAAAFRRQYRLLSTGFSIGFGDAAVYGRIHPPLAHLEMADMSGPEDVVRVDVTAGALGYEVILDGGEPDACGALDALAPLVLGRIYEEALRRQPYLLALHAAAVSNDDGALLLSNPTGSGKSTLAAAALTAGWRYGCEDIALIVPDSLELLPFPSCLSLREGAWAGLCGRLPELAMQTVHRRGGVEPVRYLPPPPSSLPVDPDQTIPVRWVVFPSHQPGARPSLNRLGKAEGLRNLLANCRGLPAPLSVYNVQRIVDWADGILFAEMVAGDVETSLSLIEKFVNVYS